MSSTITRRTQNSLQSRDHHHRVSTTQPDREASGWKALEKSLNKRRYRRVYRNGDLDEPHYQARTAIYMVTQPDFFGLLARRLGVTTRRMKMKLSILVLLIPEGNQLTDDSDRFVENGFQTELSQSRALQVLRQTKRVLSGRFSLGNTKICSPLRP
jgi:hypothetical protein